MNELLTLNKNKFMARSKNSTDICLGLRLSSSNIVCVLRNPVMTHDSPFSFPLITPRDSSEMPAQPRSFKNLYLLKLVLKY